MSNGPGSTPDAEDSVSGPAGEIHQRIDHLRQQLDEAETQISATQLAATQPAAPVAPPPEDVPAPSASPRRRARAGWIVLAALVAVAAVIVTVLALSSTGPSTRTAGGAHQTLGSVPSPSVPVAPSVAPSVPPASIGPTPTPPSSAPVPAPPAPVRPGSSSQATGPIRTLVVAPGDSFWSLARRVAASELGRPATNAEVGPVWLALIRANSSHLVHAGNPNLIYPGQTFSVPPP